MYTTPFASLRVPDVDDTDMDQSLLNLATDIQWRLDRNLARLAELSRRRGILVNCYSSPSMGSGAVVTVPFDNVSWDTDGYFTSSTTITLTRGLWLIAGSSSISGSGSLTWALTVVTGSTYGNILGKQNGPFSASVTSLSWVSGTGLLYTDGEDISMYSVQSSSGTGSMGITTLAAAKIGNL